MIGIPTETEKDLRETVNLALQLKKENQKARVGFFSIYTPYPGTAMYDMAIAEGFVPPHSLEEWAGFTGEVSNIPWSDDKRRGILKMLRFTSPFIDDEFETTPKHYLRLLSALYRPLARFRFKRLLDQVPLEIQLAKLLKLYQD